MSFSSSSRQTTSSLSQQDSPAITAENSLSTSYSNLTTNDSTSSNISTIKRHKNRRKRKLKARILSIENFPSGGDPKTLKTLKSHYYPEEQNWCFVIVFVATIVQMFNHGFHLSYGSFLVIVNSNFNNVLLFETGE